MPDAATGTQDTDNGLVDGMTDEEATAAALAEAGLPIEGELDHDLTAEGRAQALEDSGEGGPVVHRDPPPKAEEDAPGDGDGAEGAPADGAPAGDAAPKEGAPTDDAPKDGAPRELTPEERATPEEYLAEDASEKQLSLKAKWEGMRESLEANEGHVRELRQREEQVFRPIVERMMTIEQTVERTGTTPDQIDEMFTYLGHLNSGRPEGLRQARAMALKVVGEIDATLGETGTGSPDPLDRHPDLAAAVEAGDMTEELARKMALRLDKAGMTEAAYQDTRRVQHESAEQHAFREAAESAHRSVLHMDEFFLEKDPLYTEDSPLRKTLQQTYQDLPRLGLAPGQWRAYMLEQYQRVRALVAGGAAVRAAPGDGAGTDTGTGGGNGARKPGRVSAGTRGNALRPGSAARAADDNDPLNAKDDFVATEMALRNAGYM